MVEVMVQAGAEEATGTGHGGGARSDLATAGRWREHFQSDLTWVPLAYQMTAGFYLADLHVHTHDSGDYATTTEDIKPDELEQALTPSEKQWKSSGVPIPVAEYVEAIEAREPRLDIVAITDHGVCAVACELAHAAAPGLTCPH